MYNYNKTIFSLAMAIALGFSACDRDDTPPETKPEPTVEAKLKLEFTANYGTKSIDFNTDQFITAAKDTITPNKFRFLMSDIQLIKTDGSAFSYPNQYGFVNLGDNPKVEITLPEAAVGNYKAIRFNLGLDSSINHGDPSQWPSTHPLSPLVNGLHWGWAGGYIFISHEGSFMNNGAMDQYTFHVATLKFANSIEMPITYNHSAGAADVISVKCDLEKYFSSVHNFSLKNDIPASHSGSMDAVYINKLRANIATMFTASMK